MATDIAENKSKGILKRPTPAKDEDSRKAHDIATQHARIIHSRHEVEDLISETLITLSKYPFTRTPSHSASNPAPSDALAFKDGVRLFQPSDYEDLIEERNANGLCGYTLCPNPKSKMTHGGTFKLVNYGRKDFNIVPSKELERWCSQKCAKRAMYVKVQLNETAAWERAGVASIGIDLLEEEEGAEAKEITPLGGNPPSDLGATMANLFGQSSAAPYQQSQPPNGPFGTNRQTPGLPATPTTHLDPKFKAAASKDQFIWSFVSAHDKINRGQAP